MHAGVSCEGHEKDKREKLCRYIARPAVAVPRLALSSTGKVVYTLKTPYRDGTTQAAFDRGEALYDGELLGHPFRSVAKTFQVKGWRLLKARYRALEATDRASLPDAVQSAFEAATP